MNRKKFEYSSPIFRVLGVAAATEEEKEEFLEKIADQIESIATDVSGIELKLGYTDLDDVDDKVGDVLQEVRGIKSDIEKILDHVEK